MINCYFDADSYYIVGKDIEVYATMKNPETDPIRRAYWMMLMVIIEFASEKDNITFYNDTRLIDEMNGTVHPIDEWTREAKRISNSMLSSLYGIALFRKIESSRLMATLSVGREKMIDPIARQKIISSLEEDWQRKHNTRVKKLKQSFFGDKNDN